MLLGLGLGSLVQNRAPVLAVVFAEAYGSAEFSLSFSDSFSHLPGDDLGTFFHSVLEDLCEASHDGSSLFNGSLPLDLESSG